MISTHHGKIGTLKSDEVIKVFERGHLGHLGCHSKSEIYVVPISYALEDGIIYSHSKIGRKIEMMRENPQICVQVEEVQNFFEWKSAIAWGRFEELRDDQATRAMRVLIKKFAEGEAGRFSPLEVDFGAMLETAIIFRMKIERATGRFVSSLD
jgi:nitroimidazol reductase NimA-like FMN-containing flavoprotein (pyridoxamine 5'-phosphate oxidase superfamily)